MKFCSAVFKEQRIRDWEGRTDGRTNERTDIRITIYPRNFVCGGYNNDCYYVPQTKFGNISVFFNTVVCWFWGLPTHKFTSQWKENKSYLGNTMCNETIEVTTVTCLYKPVKLWLLMSINCHDLSITQAFVSYQTFCVLYPLKVDDSLLMTSGSVVSHKWCKSPID